MSAVQGNEPQFFIAGPRHPDLFGGETPVMLPIESELPGVFEVLVSYSVRSTESRFVRVLASSADEAMRLAVETAENDADFDEENFDAESVRLLDVEPTQAQLQSWCDTQRRKGGKS